MKILMELDHGTLEKYTKRTGIYFGHIQDHIPGSNDAVIVALPQSESLDKIYALNIPTVVVAGKINSGIKEKAQNIGFPGEAIIVKDGNAFRSLAGVEFFLGDGIKLSDLVTLAKYFFENDISPEIYVWKDNDPVVREEVKPKQVINHQAQGPTQQKQITDQTQNNKQVSAPERREVSKFNNNSEETRHIQVKNQPSGQSSGDPKVKTVTQSIPELLNNADRIISVYKTVSEANTSKTAFSLARRINGLHVDITGNQKLGSYATKEEPLVTGGYACSTDGSNIEVTVNHSNTMVVEIDPNFLSPELMQPLYEKSNIVIHVPGSFASSSELIASWISSGFKLDWIVVTQDYEQYAEKYPALVKTVEQVLKLIA